MVIDLASLSGNCCHLSPSSVRLVAGYTGMQFGISLQKLGPMYHSHFHQILLLQQLVVLESCGRLRILCVVQLH